MVMINDDIRCNVNNYQEGRIGKIKYIVVHYTASPNDTAEGEAKYFKNNFIGASAHYFVDERSVYRSVIDSDAAWHCGANVYYHGECRNDNSIGVELCCKKKNPTSRKAEDKDWYFDKGTVKNAAELIKYLMSEYEIPIENVVRHYDVTHKICPAPFVHNQSDWERFKDMLKGEDEMVVKGKINVNGKEYEVDKILKDGSNFIKLSDLKSMGFDVGYDEKSKVPSLGVKVEKVEVDMDGIAVEVSRILKFDENYIRLRDLEPLLKVSYEDGKVKIKSRT